jgi:hypothetical protein
MNSFRKTAIIEFAFVCLYFLVRKEPRIYLHEEWVVTPEGTVTTCCQILQFLAPAVSAIWRHFSANWLHDAGIHNSSIICRVRKRKTLVEY